jgi:spermidine synthase
VRVELNDGRNFLLATDETFDAVLSDSIHPRYAGNGSLYSREYFGLLRERMRRGASPRCGCRCIR